MRKSILSLLATGLCVVSLVGCGSGDTSPVAAPPATDSVYLATSEPQGAVGVGEARTTAEDGEDIVLLGRIGGSATPFVDGVAAFTIVDTKVPHCSAEEGCPTPWDYCCEQNQVKDNIATIKVVDVEGKLIAQDARQLLGLKELGTVVVRGKAQRDTSGNLAILASQVYVKN